MWLRRAQTRSNVRLARVGEAGNISAAAGAAEQAPFEDDVGLSRRSLLARGALAAFAAALPSVLGSKGLLDEARAQSPDLVADTFNGLVAFVVPGSDDYSVHQGESTGARGGVGAGGAPALIANLDRYVPASVFGTLGATLPASGAVAALLNDYATQVNPAPAGPFPSPFARLAFAEKADALRRFESDSSWDQNEVRFVSGILPGFATFLSLTEVGLLDRRTRKLSARPVGWDLTKYAGVAEGRAELRGYYGGRRKARG